MNLTPQIKAELLDLLAEVCEGTASDVQLRRVHTLVAENREARHFYLRHMHLAASLRWSFDAVDATHIEASSATPDLEDLLSLTPTVSRLPGGFAKLAAWRMSRMIGVAAAVIVIGYFVSLVAMLAWDRQLRGERQLELASSESGRGVATLVDSQDCQWENVSNAPLVGGSLSTTPLRLASGVAEIRFDNGATVLLEAPAEFEARTSGSGFLRRGKLLARVPQQAVGFRVETPTAAVVDLGTEFGVEVDKSGATEVEVVVGKVELHPATKRGPALTSQPIILTAGSARRIVASKTGGAPMIHEIAHTPGRFKLRADSSTRTNLYHSVGINRAATAWATSIDGGPVSALNDQIYSNQYDSGSGDASAVAITFGSNKTFNRIELYLNPGWVIRGFEVQVAKPGLTWPDVNNNEHWATISGGSFKNQAADGQDAFIFDQNLASSGVRILATDKNNIADRKMRIREVMVFDRYRNIAPNATVSTGSDLWHAGTVPFNNELISNQTAIDCTVPRTIDFTWPTPHTIGSFTLVGGSGYPTEVLRDFTIEADLGNGLQTLVTHADNPSKVTNDILAKAISTTHVRLTITSAIGTADTLARVSEFYIFAPCEQISLQKR